MSDEQPLIDRDVSVGVTLSLAQLNTLISAMYDKNLDNDRYLSGRQVGDEPAAHESCCAYHLAQYHHNKQMRDALLAQREHHLETIALLEKTLGVETAQCAEGPHRQGSGTPPFAICLDAAAVRDEIEDAAEAHGLDPQQAAAICALDDHDIGHAIDASLTDGFYEHYDSVRRDAIAGLRRDVENAQNSQM